MLHIIVLNLLHALLTVDPYLLGLFNKTRNDENKLRPSLGHLNKCYVDNDVTLTVVKWPHVRVMGRHWVLSNNCCFCFKSHRPWTKVTDAYVYWKTDMMISKYIQVCLHKVKKRQMHRFINIYISNTCIWIQTGRHGDFRIYPIPSLFAHG